MSICSTPGPLLRQFMRLSGRIQRGLRRLEPAARIVEALIGNHALADKILNPFEVCLIRAELGFRALDFGAGAINFLRA